MKNPKIKVAVSESEKILVRCKYQEGGLAITPFILSDRSLGNLYHITHIDSGWKIPSMGMQYKYLQARRVLAWLLEMYDWRKSKAQILKDFNLKKMIPLKALISLEAMGWDF